MINHAIKQQRIVESEYLYLIQEHVSQEAWVAGAHQRKWPVNARYMWALQAVYAPRKQETKEAAE